MQDGADPDSQYWDLRSFFYGMDFSLQVLPIARSCFSQEKQHELMYQSLCVMPLKLLECALPWLVSKINDQERSLFHLNIHFGASM